MSVPSAGTSRFLLIKYTSKRVIELARIPSQCFRTFSLDGCAEEDEANQAHGQLGLIAYAIVKTLWLRTEN